MKLAAFLFTLLLGFLIVQPVTNFEPVKIMKESCSSKRSCCGSKKTSPVKKDCSDKDDCGKMGCNPFMSCIYGNFFIIAKVGYSIDAFMEAREKMFTYNDMRITGSISDCWHPPEAMS